MDIQNKCVWKMKPIMEGSMNMVRVTIVPYVLITSILVDNVVYKFGTNRNLKKKYMI